MSLDRTSVLLSNITDVDALLAAAVECDAAGLPRVWLAETAAAEAASIGAVIARTTRLEVGTSIVPVFTRTPGVLAMMAATWSRLGAGRRVHLGIGAGGQGIVEKWHGVPYDKPLSTTRDTLRILRQALSGERTDHVGEMRSSTGLRLALGSTDASLYVGGVGPKMVELAAAEADGLIVTWLSPEMLSAFRVDFNASIATAGRKTEDLRLVARVYVGMGPDLTAIRESVRQELVEYVVSPPYARYFESVGFGDEVAKVNDRFKARDREGAVAAVSDAILDALLVTAADAEELRPALLRYLEAGADEVMVQPVPEARGGDLLLTCRSVAEAMSGVRTP